MNYVQTKFSFWLNMNLLEKTEFCIKEMPLLALFNLEIRRKKMSLRWSVCAEWEITANKCFLRLFHNSPFLGHFFEGRPYMTSQVKGNCAFFQEYILTSFMDGALIQMLIPRCAAYLLIILIKIIETILLYQIIG